jgi:hypothetical protein
MEGKFERARAWQRLTHSMTPAPKFTSVGRDVSSPTMSVVAVAVSAANSGEQQRLLVKIWAS